MKHEILNALNKLEDANTDELYMSIGLSLNSQSEKLQFNLDDFKAIKKAGYRSFLEAKEVFRNQICSSPDVIDYLSDQRSLTRMEIAAGIADILLSHYDLVSACSMAVLILNESLITFCKIQE